MMTNFEKWKDELLRLGVEGKDNIACVNGKPIPCTVVNDCCECDFNKDSCDGKFLLWLYDEYIEPKPKLTKREWHFLNYVTTGWIARDVEGAVCWFNEEPYRDVDVWDVRYAAECIELDSKLFPFIKWDNEELWKVKDLLKLEVSNE